MLKAKVVFGVIYDSSFDAVLDGENPTDFGFVKTNADPDVFQGYLGIELVNISFPICSNFTDVGREISAIKLQPEECQKVQDIVNSLPEKIKVLVYDVGTFVIWGSENYLDKPLLAKIKRAIREDLEKLGFYGLRIENVEDYLLLKDDYKITQNFEVEWAKDGRKVALGSKDSEETNMKRLVEYVRHLFVTNHMNEMKDIYNQE